MGIAVAYMATSCPWTVAVAIAFGVIIKFREQPNIVLKDFDVICKMYFIIFFSFDRSFCVC